MVAITGNVSSELIGRDAFQEIYITGITMPITKHNFLINDAADISDAIREAFRIANSGRKGPVLIDITKDATINKAEYTKRAPGILPEPLKITSEEARHVAELINASKRPVIYCGGGVISAESSHLIRQLADLCDIPVCCSMMGSGIIEYDNPHNLGMVGMHGSVAANLAVDESDLLLAIGVRFPDRVALNTKKFAKSAQIVHIDADRGELNKNVKVALALRCDIKDALTNIFPFVQKSSHSAWAKKIDEWKNAYPHKVSSQYGIDPKALLEEVSKLSEDDAVFVTDVGQHQMWSAQYLHHKEPRRFLTSGGLGTMGFGYGAAIGARYAKPKSRIVHLTGDGSFHMNLNEVCTAVSYKLPIITVIFNNKVLGMVYQWQSQFYGERYSSTDPGRQTDFSKVAEAFGAKGYAASTLEEFISCYKEALKEDGPVWIDCLIDKDVKVLPMIPGGGTVEDMITE